MQFAVPLPFRGTPAAGSLAQAQPIGLGASTRPVSASSVPSGVTPARSQRVLLIDDERVLRETLAFNLRRNGFEVTTAEDGTSGLAAARTLSPDIILLDVLLPGGMDGFEVCRLLRQQVRCPIILLSALGDEVDRVVGLEVGADDYVTKPFATAELLARVRAHLRRADMRTERAEETSPPAGAAAPISVGQLVVDPLRREVRLGARTISLKRREFDLLQYLARHAGITLTRSQLLEAVWPEDVPARDASRTVDVHVHRLRDRIEPDSAHPRYLHTVRGLGYVLRAPAAENKSHENKSQPSKP